jgi:hypothetical protein
LQRGGLESLTQCKKDRSPQSLLRSAPTLRASHIPPTLPPPADEPSEREERGERREEMERGRGIGCVTQLRDRRTSRERTLGEEV